MTVPETCLVEAPSDLPEGYLFDATVDGITVGSQKCRLRAWCCFLFILAPLSIRGDSDETVLARLSLYGDYSHHSCRFLPLHQICQQFM